MKIAYVGRFDLGLLAREFTFDHEFPDVNWSFGLGGEFVSGLVKRGHTVHAMVDALVDSVERYNSKCGKLSVWLVPCRRRSRWSFLTMFSKEVRGLRNVINLVKPDVVFAQWTYHNAYAGILSGYPTLVVAHDSPWRVALTYRTVASFIKAFYAQLFVFPRLKFVTAVSPHIVEDLRRLNGFKGTIQVIPNGMRIGWRANEEVKCDKDIRRNAKTIVCVSQIGRLKNTKALAKAFEMLHVKHADWRLKMYGQGLPDGMVTHEDLDRVLKDEADVFCSPSLEESFGMVFVEAMLQGVPCVGGEKSGAVPWVMGDGGVTCDVMDPHKIADCIERVMLDFDMRKRMSANGIKRVIENFNIEHVVDLYEKALERVLEDSKVLVSNS